MKNKDRKDYIHENTYQNAGTGYILTPPDLSHEMVDTFPKIVFESSTTTFLDPICKSGTFLFEITERLFEHGHSIKNIQSRIFTVDYNHHSLNIAQGAIRQILRTNTSELLVNINKYSFIEESFNVMTRFISNNKIKTFEDFLYILLLDKKDYELIDMLNETVKNFIERYEKISKEESKLFGEVFTPKALIDEMLDTLPKEVWKNKDLKWLDPAAGINNFFSVVVDRLMIGLSDEIKNDTERYKWIVEEMLYACELQAKNIFILYNLFDRNNDFNLNVYRGSFLSEGFDEHMKDVWGLDHVDIIVGNPPFQDSEKSQVKLWPLFILKSVDILSENGYISMIFPSVWIYRPDGQKFKKLTSIFSKYQLLNITIDNGIKWFNIGESTAHILFHKKLQYKNSIFKYKDNSVIIDIKYNAEKILFDEKDKIIEKINQKVLIKTKELSKYNWYEDFHHNDSKEKMFSDNRLKLEREQNDLPIWYTASQKYFTNEKNINKNWRVLVNLSGHYYSSEYPDKYLRIVKNEGNTSGMKSILCESENEAKRLYSILKSNLYRFFNESQKTSGFNTAVVNFPGIIPTKIMTDNDIYEYFDLTKEEIDFIEKTIK